MRLLPLLLFLSACATPSGAYMDGAPLAPPEPRVTYTPTGAGLPEYWGTPEAPKVERSPHKRDLPPMREPGLWAGDQPRAATRPAWADRDPVVLGRTLPLLDGFDPDDVHQQVVKRCAYLAALVAATPQVEALLERMSPRETDCYVARMYEFCSKDDLTQLLKGEMALVNLPAPLREAINKSAASAGGYAFIMCHETDTDAVKDAVKTSKPIWKSMDRRHNAPQ